MDIEETQTRTTGFPSNAIVRDATTYLLKLICRKYISINLTENPKYENFGHLHHSNFLTIQPISMAVQCND